MMHAATALNGFRSPTHAGHTVRVVMAEAASVKKRGLPPGEEGAASPPVVGKVEALDFLRKRPTT